MTLVPATTFADTPSGRATWGRNVADAIRALINTQGKHGTKTVDSDYTISARFDVAPEGLVLEVDTTGGNVTVTLPQADLVTGKLLFIKRMTAGANTLTIDGNGSETIDGSATLALSSQYEAVGLCSNGSNWVRTIYIPGGGGGTTTNALTINNGGAGAASGATFNGSAPITISYNSIGAQPAGSYLTGNQTITLSGDVTGSGATAIAATLATVNSDVGAFGSANAIPVVTANAKGLVTAVSTATPALTYIGSYSPSAVASLDIENFAGLSNRAVIIIDIEYLTVSADSIGITAQFKLNGSYKSASYKWSRRNVFSPTTGSSNGSGSDSSMSIFLTGAGGMGNQAGEGGSGTLEIFNAFDTAGQKRMAYRVMWIDDQATPRQVFADGGGSYSGADFASALAGIRLAASSGTFSGKIHVYARSYT